MTGAGAPPTPGMSNRMTGRRGSSSSTNGWNISRLAPMPLHSSSGGQPAAPSRTETRRARPPTVRSLIRSAGATRRSRPSIRPRPDPERSVPVGSGSEVLMVVNIRARSFADGLQPAAAQFRGRGLLVPAALGQPVRVVRPPGPVAGLGPAQPLLRVFRALLGELVTGLFVAGRVDHRGDVPAGGQDEPRPAGQQLGGPVAALPGADVVGDPGGLVGVPVNRGQVHR